MPENETPQGDEKLLILPLGEESKKITQVISNDTARQIIELLADAPLSASDIAEHLQTPLTTIVYNLENLEKVGLIKIEKIKYSEKGREVKIYAPVRKLIIVVPEKTDKKSIIDILRKYVGVVLAAVFASGIMEFLSFRSSAPQNVIKSYSYEMTDNLTQAAPASLPEAANESAKVAISGLADINQTLNTSAQPAATAAPSPVVTSVLKEGGTVSRGGTDIFTNIADTISAHPGLTFLLGCIFVIVLLALWDYHKRKKN